MARLLVVEDQRTLLESVQQGLEGEGYAVLTAASGAEGYRIAVEQSPDAVILDLMLPDGDGLETLSRLRNIGFRKPVLIMTARTAIEDRIVGLDTGADDYLVKPFAFGEMVARLRALFRRTTAPDDSVLRVEDLEMELLTRRVVRSGEELELTAREFAMLEYFLRHKNEVVSREAIAINVWKSSTATWTNVIEVMINRLRKKLDRPDLSPLLHTIYRQGYLLGAKTWNCGASAGD